MFVQLSDCFIKYSHYFTIAQASIPITWLILVRKENMWEISYLDIFYLFLIIFFAIIQATKEYKLENYIREKINNETVAEYNSISAEHLTNLFRYTWNFLCLCFESYSINVYMYLQDPDKIHLRKKQKIIETRPSHMGGLEVFDPRGDGRNLTISIAYLENKTIYTNLTIEKPVLSNEINFYVDDDTKWVLATSLKDEQGQAIGVISFTSLSKVLSAEDSNKLDFIINSFAQAISAILIFEKNMIQRQSLRSGIR